MSGVVSRGQSRSHSTIELQLDVLEDSFDPSELSPASEWRELSDGGYSEVYKALLLGVPVAVKQATSRKKTSGEALMREMRYLRQIGPHPNVVQPYGCFLEHSKLHLVMQYTRHCLRSDRVARQCDPIRVMAGIARALVRIHSIGIIHRDLKARHHPRPGALRCAARAHCATSAQAPVAPPLPASPRITPAPAAPRSVTPPVGQQHPMTYTGVFPALTIPHIAGTQRSGRQR